jgi:hypothetical protein
MPTKACEHELLVARRRQRSSDHAGCVAEKPSDWPPQVSSHSFESKGEEL